MGFDFLAAAISPDKLEKYSENTPLDNRTMGGILYAQIITTLVLGLGSKAWWPPAGSGLRVLFSRSAGAA